MPSKDKDFVNKDGKKTYGDEQEELKKAFLEAVEREFYVIWLMWLQLPLQKTQKH